MDKIKNPAKWQYTYDRIVEWRLKGHTAKEIAQMFNERGVTTAMGKKFTSSHIYTFITNYGLGLKDLEKDVHKLSTSDKSLTTPKV